jgi:oxalate decarboxylase/phosphoglucose isomerase-like protein (cupin superfamily)
MSLSRRGVLAATAAGGAAMTATLVRAATFGNPDQPPEGAVNVTNPGALTISGPHDTGLAGTMPTFLNPPATDVGSLPQFWASFNLAPRRIQDGGWGRQVTVADFAISTEIAGVNMRLSAGGIRELHWHQQAEWAIMTYGNCRITILDALGRPYVADVKEGDLWYFPTGLRHSLQGLGPDGAEFVLAFDNGVSSEFNTLLATDWMAHTPPEVLAIRPGAMRKMHWHPNADEWQYYLKGTGRMTVFNAGPSANTANFHPGDIGYVQGLGHYIENTATPTWYSSPCSARRVMRRFPSPTRWPIPRRRGRRHLQPGS